MSWQPYLSLSATRLPAGTRDTDHAGRDLDEAEAWALAQLVKRLGYSDCRSKADGDTEAHLMLEALAKLQSALADAGVSPR